MPVDIHSGIFFERQQGGLCRMHALNAYFGYAKITPLGFNKYIAVYDDYLKTRFNITTSCAQFDLVNSDQTNIVSYVLKRHNIHARYYALNQLYDKPLDMDILKAPMFFVYTEGHIWGVRLKGGRHYKVDSIGGVIPFNIRSISSMRNTGFLVPVPLKYEWCRQVQIIKDILDTNHRYDKAQICDYLQHLHRKKENLGDLEIPLGVSIGIMETNLRPGFTVISDIVNKYHEFVKQFTAGRYTDIDLVLQYVPDILLTLIGL
jgi:hypothetical protein